MASPSRVGAVSVYNETRVPAVAREDPFPLELTFIRIMAPTKKVRITSTTHNILFFNIIVFIEYSGDFFRISAYYTFLPGG